MNTDATPLTDSIHARGLWHTSMLLNILELHPNPSLEMAG